MSGLGRLRILMVMAAALAAVPAEAYYHYVHYLTPGAPYTPVFEKFDLSALPSKTVTFLVTDGGPTAFAPSDDFASVLSQVKQATRVWNSVASSDLRVVFGGVEAASQPASTPGGDVVFTDLPPGVLGLGTPTTVGTPVKSIDGSSFIPILRATVLLSKDTNKGAGPSYLESYFTTAVHEMGHALGLQHTFTAAAMSQGVIRNTSRTRPIDVDDIAGLSMLYGKAGYAAVVGSIAGRVTSNGQGVALASVVAITAGGPAISTLTNPDGTYRIDGLPPNQYWVYVHPLPPDALQDSGIKPPQDSAGHSIAASGAVETLFYAGPGVPGTRDPAQFGVVPVAAGAATADIDFAVQPRPGAALYYVATYSYIDPTLPPISPAFLNTTVAVNAIAAQALDPSTLGYVPTPTPLSVTVPGFSNADVQAYNAPVVTLALYLTSPLISSTGPRHLLFNFGNDMYVLPDGLVLVQKGAPVITAVTPNADGTATVSGVNFGPDSQVFFDGLPATVAVPFNGDGTNSSITVVPPPGYSGQTAHVIVYNSDGQNSTFYQAQSPPTYTYPVIAAPQITVTPAALPAGAFALVDVTGANMQFVDGRVTVGFGTFDVAVQRVWVLSPTHAIANVAVAPSAIRGVSEVSVISGFQTAFQPLAFQTQVANPVLPTAAGVINADAYQQTLYPGAIASLFGSNLTVVGGTAQVTLNDQIVQILYAAANQINFVVPAGLPTGPAILKVLNGSNPSFPTALQIDSPPPIIVGVTGALSLSLGASQSAASGDTVFVSLSGVDPSLVGSQGRIRVSVGGVDMPVAQVIAGPAAGTVQVIFQITQSFGGSAVPLVVTVDAGHTDPYTIAVR